MIPARDGVQHAAQEAACNPCACMGLRNRNRRDENERRQTAARDRSCHVPLLCSCRVQFCTTYGGTSLSHPLPGPEAPRAAETLLRETYM